MTPDPTPSETRTQQSPPLGAENERDSLLLVSLCREWEAARRERRFVTPAELCADRPDLLPDLLRALDVLEVIGDGPTLPAELSEVAPPRLAGYDVLGVLGRGGMGVVYSARHRALNRVVALKLIADPEGASSGRLARFRQEAEAVARLQHPNIVQIFETGVTDGRPYLTLEFVDGGTLRQRTAGVPQPPRNAAQLIETVARAVHHAHEHRIVHRDLKPANILLTAAGVPKVADFGLARALDAGAALTVTADFLGTPAYAAPEQFHNRPASIGPATDVYGLGATLYELLAGRPPFESGSLPELLLRVADEEPVPLRRLRPDCPRDLETICQKCLDKKPVRRYPSALALAEDLRRFLADEPILARPVGPVGRGWRWAKRNPAVAGLIAAIGFVLTAAAVTGAVLASSRAAALDDTRQALDRAVRAEEEGQRKLFASYVSEANAIRASGQPGQRFIALDKLRQALALGEKIELTPADRLAARNAAVAALCQPDLCPGPDWDPDAPEPGTPPETVARARAYRFRPPGNTVPEPIRGVSSTGRFVVIAPRPRRLETDNPFELWRIDGPAPVRVLSDSLGSFGHAAAFTSDDRKLAVGRKDGTVTVYATDDGRVLVPPFQAGPCYMGSLVWHPDNNKLAVIQGGEGQGGSEQRVWDTAARSPTVWASVRHVVGNGGAAFHPSGRVLATPGTDGFIHLWELPSGHSLGGWRSRQGGGASVAFNGTGDLIAGGDWGRTTRLWDAGTGHELAQLANTVIDLAFLGNRLGTPAHRDGRFYDCRVSGGRERRVLNASAADGFETTEWAAAHPGGRLVATGTGRAITLVDLATGRTVARIATADPHRFRFDDRGGLWTSTPGVTGEHLLRWPVTADPTAPHRLTVGPPEPVATNLSGERYSTSADGLAVAVGCGYAGRMFRPGGAVPVRTFGPQHDVRWAYLSPDGKLLASMTFHTDESNVQLKVWDTATGRHVANIPVGGAAGVTGFSPDGHWLYTSGGGAPAYRRWDLSAVGADLVPAWEATFPRPHGGASPDGRIVARQPGTDGIALHDAADDRELVRLPLVGGIRFWCWSADGSRLFVVGADDGKLSVFDLRLIRRGLAELGLDWDPPQSEPAPAWEGDPAVPPLEVNVLGAHAALSMENLAAAERDRAVTDLAVNPLDPDARYRLGLWLLRGGRAADAYRHLAAAVALDPDRADAWLPLAEAAFQTNNWDVAVTAATRATAADPKDPRPLQLRGRAEMRRGRHTEAAPAFAEALEVRPNNIDLLLDRAEAYHAAGEHEKAAADERRSDELVTNLPGTANNLAWRLVTGPPADRNPARALELMRKVIALNPHDAVDLNTFGVVLYRNRLYSEAADALERSLAAGGGGADAYDLFFLAVCHHKLGKATKAQQEFAAAVRWVERVAPRGHTHAELAEFRREAEAELVKPR